MENSKLRTATFSLLFIIAASLLLICVEACRADVPGNPDRVPSIGLDIMSTSLSGTVGATFFGYSGTFFTQDVHTRALSTNLNVRVPLTSSLTVNMNVGTDSVDTTNTATAENPIGTEFFRKGNHFGGGIRWYVQ